MFGEVEVNPPSRQDDRQEGNEEQERGQGLPGDAGTRDDDEIVDQPARQVDGGDGKQALDREQRRPRRGPPAGRFPDESQSAGQVRELFRRRRSPVPPSR